MPKFLPYQPNFLGYEGNKKEAMPQILGVKSNQKEAMPQILEKEKEATPQK